MPTTNLFSNSRPQSGSSNLNYYNTITQPNPVGSAMGNNNAPAYFDGGGWQQGQSATPYLQTYLGNRNPYGTSGLNLENSLAGIGANAGRVDPRLYNYGYTQVDQSEGGTERMFSGNSSVNPRGLITRNGQEYVQAGQSLDRIIDPTKVTYDDEFGLLTTADNISMPEGNLEKYMPLAVTAALGIPTLAHAGLIPGLGGGATPTATTAATPTATAASPVAGTVASGGGASGVNLGTYGSMTAGLDGGNLALPASTGVNAAAGTGTAASTAGNFLTGAGGRAAVGAAGFINSLIGSRNLQNSANSAANRADPFGQANREEAIKRLWELYNDPSSVENTPGYKFRQEQGEQGISRGAAKSGYLRSPNVLFDLAKFNSGLAEQAFKDERDTLLRMAGVDFNPANAAQIQANGSQQSENMRAAGITQLINAGGNFWDWLNGVGA